MLDMWHSVFLITFLVGSTAIIGYYVLKEVISDYREIMKRARVQGKKPPKFWFAPWGWFR